MTADIIVDLEDHVRNGNVYLVEVDMSWVDDKAEPDHGFINYDLYLVATSSAQASYLASCLYPNADGLHVADKPITEFEYASRRNRSIL